MYYCLQPVKESGKNGVQILAMAEDLIRVKEFENFLSLVFFYTSGRVTDLRDV